MTHLRLLPVYLLAFVSISALTYEQGILMHVEEVVQRWHSQVTYKYVGDGWVEFTDVEGRTFRKYVPANYAVRGLQPKKIITIHVPSIDTAGFGIMFSKIASVPIGNSSKHIIGIHLNDNTRYLAGGMSKSMQFQGTRIYAYNALQGSTELYYSYDIEDFVPIEFGKYCDTVGIQLAIEGSGYIGVVISDSLNFTPRAPYAKKLGQSGSAQRPRVFDFDNDKKMEILSGFYSDKPGEFRISAITKYDEGRDTLEIVTQDGFGNRMAWGSWAVGAFDMDHQGEYATGTIGGVVFFVEYSKVSGDYHTVFVDTTRYSNSDFHREGDDIDKDGRPEVFIGSSLFGGQSNIAVYESIGDNVYEISAWIEITGVGSLNHAIHASDVDGDGADELILIDGGILMVLKCNGNDEYSIFWMKIFQSEIKVNTFDLDGNGVDDLLVSQSSPTWDGFTEVYSFNKSTGVSSVQCASDFRIASIYPNPAHESVTLNIVAGSVGKYEISIYNRIGKLELHSGGAVGSIGESSIRIPTGGLDNGVYYYTLTHNNQSHTGKFVVMR